MEKLAEDRILGGERMPPLMTKKAKVKKKTRRSRRKLKVKEGSIDALGRYAFDVWPMKQQRASSTRAVPRALVTVGAPYRIYAYTYVNAAEKLASLRFHENLEPGKSAQQRLASVPRYFHVWKVAVGKDAEQHVEMPRNIHVLTPLLPDFIGEVINNVPN